MIRNPSELQSVNELRSSTEIRSDPETDREKLLNQVLQAESDPKRKFILARNWIDAYLENLGEEESGDPARGYRDELAWLVFSGGPKNIKPIAEESVAISRSFRGITRGFTVGR